MTAPASQEHRRGVMYGLAAYTLWGLVPLYWPALQPMSALEILAHRVIWSVLLLAVILTATRGWSKVHGISARSRRWLLLAAILVSINWGMFIWAVNNNFVVESALGYFINPLVSIALGVVVLRERLEPRTWFAVGLAALGVLVLTIGTGRPPWIALVLALSFGFYGLVKKTAAVDAVPSLMLETTYMLPIALAYLGWLWSQGQMSFGEHGGFHAFMVALAGPVTAVPLLLFGAAANRIPLALLGILQYVGPVLQFILGVAWFHEDMPPARWAGFILVWLALVVFTLDGWRNSRARVAPESDPVRP